MKGLQTLSLLLRFSRPTLQVLVNRSLQRSGLALIGLWCQPRRVRCHAALA